MFDLGANFMDFPDLTITDDFLYISVCPAKGANKIGFLAARIALNQLVGPGRIHFEFTDFATRDDRMFEGRLVQNAHGQAIWAAHVDTHATVFNWPMAARRLRSENSCPDVVRAPRSGPTDPPGIPIPIKSMTPPVPATDPAKRVAANWLFLASTAVMAGVQRRNEVIFGWTSERGGAYPHPHVRLVTIDTLTWTVTRESQIWNPGMPGPIRLALTHRRRSVLRLAGGAGMFISAAPPSEYPRPTFFGILSRAIPIF